MTDSQTPHGPEASRLAAPSENPAAAAPASSPPPAASDAPVAPADQPRPVPIAVRGIAMNAASGAAPGTSSAGAPKAAAAKKPAKPLIHGPWRFATLLIAPHRLGFFCAMLVLLAASLWWALVQHNRAIGIPALAPEQAPLLTHAAVMVFGFMPLFFSGFLFTAGPRWLGVPPHGPKVTAPAVIMQTIGWLLWLAGAHVSATLALAGMALAAAGLGWMVAQFWQLIARSSDEDQVHARSVGLGGIVGVASLGGACLALALARMDVALLCIHTGLWGFIVVTYVTVAHRMIPFFTSNVLPMIALWRPFWVLWLMLGVCAWQALAVWVQALLAPGAWWSALALTLEAAAGAVLLWLAIVWGLVQSMKIRLLAMLHVGFVWLGLALVYGALGRALALWLGHDVLGLGPLHLLGMGFLGSIMLAMVTRVSCGHSGRALVADSAVWSLFWTLQGAVIVRTVAAMDGAPAWLLLLAALIWAAIMLVWCLRFGNWYGRPRSDGKPG